MLESMKGGNMVTKKQIAQALDKVLDEQALFTDNSLSSMVYRQLHKQGLSLDDEASPQEPHAETGTDLFLVIVEDIREFLHKKYIAGD